jgi:hypothetical protein
MVIHFIGEGDNRVGKYHRMSKKAFNTQHSGNGQSQHTSNIQLKGLSILPDHAVIKNKDNKKFTITPLKAIDILVNGKQITGEHTLNQNDRQVLIILFKYPLAGFYLAVIISTCSLIPRRAA